MSRVARRAIRARLRHPRASGDPVSWRETLGPRLRGDDECDRAATVAANPARWRAYALVAPALAVIALFFVLPLVLSVVLALSRQGRRLHARALRRRPGSSTAPTSCSRRRSSLLSTVLIGARRDRDRRLPDARREPARGRDPALAVSLAAVHPVHRHRPADAHVPRQERDAEPRADRRRADRAARRAEHARLARHRHRVRLEAGAVRDAAAGRRDGVARPQHIEAARNLGASPRCACCSRSCCRRCAGTLLVGLVLSFVTMLSVLSVPLMINPNSPTMITVDVAYRINTHSRLRRWPTRCASMSLVARGGRARGSICGTRCAQGARRAR